MHNSGYGPRAIVSRRILLLHLNSILTVPPDNPHDLHRVQEVPKLASSIDRDIRHSVISCMIPNTNQTSGGVVEMVGPIVEGQDWISGRKFFIRSKRHPDVYWWVHDNHVHASPHQRTKFQIERVADAKENQQGELVMIRSDKVTVKVLGVAPSTTPGGERKPAAPRYLRAACLNTRVEVSDVEHTWEFGKLVNGDVGIYWEDGDTSGGAGQARPFVVWTPDGEGDEWELV